MTDTRIAFIIVIFLTTFSFVSVNSAAALSYGPPIGLSEPHPATSNFFGWTVSISGNNVLIGSPGNATYNRPTSGAAYLFDAITGQLLQRFSNPNLAPENHDFGFSVSVSGNNVLIGTPSNATLGVTHSGSAYLFNATTGHLLQRFSEPQPTAGNLFGSPVSISGNNVLIGKSNNSQITYLFNATTGQLLQNFSIGGPLSISDNKALIFTQLFDAATGQLLHSFSEPSPNPLDFGVSVSISDNKVLVGSNNATAGQQYSGAAYLFDATTGQLLHSFSEPHPALDNHFGSSVSISGNNVLIGSPWNATAGQQYSGAAYLFDATTGQLLHSFSNPHPAYGNHFGSSVSISGNFVLIGTPDNTTSGQGGSGAAYLFKPISAPINANPDFVKTIKNIPVNIPVLGNDSPGTTIQSFTQGTIGVVNGPNLDGMLTYIPKKNVSGTDSFLYTIADGVGNTNQAVVSVTILNNSHCSGGTGNNFAGCDYSWASLPGFNLSGANLKKVNFANADLKGANLGGSNMMSVILKNANLQGARLGGANMHNVNLQNANLQGAKLGGVNLSNAILVNTNLKHTVLVGTNLHNANLQHADLSYANLSGANISGADFTGANITGCNGCP